MSLLYSKLPETGVSPHIGTGGFEAGDGRTCLAMAAQCKPDIVLLDISMPGMNGWAVASALGRPEEVRPLIVMVSANANDGDRTMDPLRDAFLAKPIAVQHLLATIARLLDIEWIRDAAPAPADGAPTLPSTEIPPARHRDELRRLGRIGHIRGIQAKLDEIMGEAPERRLFVEHMRALVADVDLAKYMATLDALDSADV